MNSSMVLWCGLCNSRPADGMLEVLFEGDTQTTKMQVCTPCVMKIPDEGWLVPENVGKSTMTLDEFKVEPDV